MALFQLSLPAPTCMGDSFPRVATGPTDPLSSRLPTTASATGVSTRFPPLRSFASPIDSTKPRCSHPRRSTLRYATRNRTNFRLRVRNRNQAAKACVLPKAIRNEKLICASACTCSQLFDVAVFHRAKRHREYGIPQDTRTLLGLTTITRRYRSLSANNLEHSSKRRRRFFRERIPLDSRSAPIEPWSKPAPAERKSSRPCG